MACRVTVTSLLKGDPGHESTDEVSAGQKSGELSDLQRDTLRRAPRGRSWSAANLPVWSCSGIKCPSL